MFAGEEMLATFVDGTVVKVRVRQMPARHLITKVLPALADKTESIELCCEAVPGTDPLPPQWSDNLTDESGDKLWQKVRELNFSRAMKLAEDSVGVATQLLPLNQKMKSFPAS
jgi:hypothetical protein